MTDVFMSYAKEDRDRAARIAEACARSGFAVWWDRLGLAPGDRFRNEIQRQLTGSKCVMVLWSPSSVNSEWVLDEATECRHKLVPVLLEAVAIPLGFRQLQTADLSGWSGDPEAPTFRELLRGIRRFVSGPERGPPGDGTGIGPPTTIEVQQHELIVTGPPQPSGVALDMAVIPPGRFTMGSESGVGLANERPAHDVRIARPFLLATTPVTNAQYRVFVDACDAPHPMSFSVARLRGDDQPVVGIAWEDAIAFCAWSKTRLPTEAEWEYACRAGSTTEYWSGDTDQALDRVGWYYENSGNGTNPVAAKPRNPFGLYDMHGNVYEWCQDWLADYANSPTDGSVPIVAASGRRVLRGGSWFAAANRCRSASRAGRALGSRGGEVGFRPARDLE